MVCRISCNTFLVIWHIPHNTDIDPYYQGKWPSPWQIIEKNKYDDFTKALMITWSLKLTNRFKESDIKIILAVDRDRHNYYNVVCVNEEWAINYNDEGPILIKDLPDSILTENIIEPVLPH